MLKTVVLAAALAAGSATVASAHITLETQRATVGGSYKAVFRVGHGCEGLPTIRVHLQVPEGYFAVKPMPKPGWTLEIVKGKYENSYDNHGTMVSEGVKEVIWSGGSLLDEHFDEFVVRGTLAASLPTDTTLYFPISQECETGAHRWIEIPAEGQSSDDLEEPAPGLLLLPRS